MRYWFRRSTTRQWIVAVLSLLIGGGALVAALLTSFDLGGARQVQGAAHPNDQTLRPVVAGGVATQSYPPIDADAVVAAFNCARAQQSLDAYVRDAALDQDAQQWMARLRANGQRHLHADETDYPLTGQLLLSRAVAPEGCAVGGFDVTRIENLSRASHIGVAVADLAGGAQPPLVIAVIVGR